MKTLVLLVLSFATCVAARAQTSSPAQAGYCVQTLRTMLEVMSQSLGCESPLTPAQCNAINAPVRQQIGEDRRLFDQWRLVSVSMMNGNSSFEFLRGVAQAKSDWAYQNERSSAWMNECQSVADVAGCMSEKSKESNPMIEGIRARIDPCMRGPGL